MVEKMANYWRLEDIHGNRFMMRSGAPQQPGQPGLEPRHFFKFTKWVIFLNRPKTQ